MKRRYSPTDRLLMQLQQGMNLLDRARRPLLDGPDPADNVAAGKPLDEQQRQHAAGLMRVNHAGEVAAQALYQGQALVARDAALREHLLQAADEEKAHLQWCARRVEELGERTSRLSPLWYAGSLAIGAAAGLAGDRWSLGFVAETERQVADHLEDHMRNLPADDDKSRSVVRAMRQDEVRHGREAQDRGGAELPAPVRGLMQLSARLMKTLAYRL